MRNVTLKMDEALLKKARHIAVDRNQSLSGWVAELIAREVKANEAAEKARSRALGLLKTGFELKPAEVSRAILHER